MIATKELTEWGSVAMVVISGAMAGHHAAVGMNPTQWMGAIAAVLGSVAVAVAVRVWPAPAKANAED